jgi:hypothetical protein
MNQHKNNKRPMKITKYCLIFFLLSAQLVTMNNDGHNPRKTMEQNQSNVVNNWQPQSFLDCCQDEETFGNLVNADKADQINKGQKNLQQNNGVLDKNNFLASLTQPLDSLQAFFKETGKGFNNDFNNGTVKPLLGLTNIFNKTNQPEIFGTPGVPHQFENHWQQYHHPLTIIEKENPIDLESLKNFYENHKDELIKQSENQVTQTYNYFAYIKPFLQNDSTFAVINNRIENDNPQDKTQIIEKAILCIYLFFENHAVWASFHDNIKFLQWVGLGNFHRLDGEITLIKSQRNFYNNIDIDKTLTPFELKKEMNETIRKVDKLRQSENPFELLLFSKVALIQYHDEIHKIYPLDALQNTIKKAIKTLKFIKSKEKKLKKINGDNRMQNIQDNMFNVLHSLEKKNKTIKKPSNESQEEEKTHKKKRKK